MHACLSCLAEAGDGLLHAGRTGPKLERVQKSVSTTRSSLSSELVDEPAHLHRVPRLRLVLQRFDQLFDLRSIDRMTHPQESDRLNEFPGFG